MPIAYSQILNCQERILIQIFSAGAHLGLYKYVWGSLLGGKFQIPICFAKGGYYIVLDSRYNFNKKLTSKCLISNGNTFGGRWEKVGHKWGSFIIFHFSLNHCGNYVPSGGSVEYFLFPLMNKRPWKSCRENSNHSQISVLYGTRADSWIDPICVGNLDCVISLHFRKNRKVFIQKHGESDKKNDMLLISIITEL